MSQSIIPLSEMQTRVEALGERVAALGAKWQTRMESKSFKSATAEAQAKTLVAGALFTAIASPMESLAEAMRPMLPPAEGSNLFADIAQELAEEALEEHGVKKDAMLLAVAEANSRILPLLEQLAEEAEQKLA